MISSGPARQANGNLPEGPEQILVVFGAAVLCAQTTERLLHFCMVYVLQVDGDINIEILRKYEISKKTLGQLIASLRRHIGLHKQFDAYLGEYLEKRNILIHDVGRIEGGWSLSSPEGVANAKAFLNRLLALDAIIRRILIGLIRAWAATKPLRAMPPFPDMSENDYMPSEVLDGIFFAKE